MKHITKSELASILSISQSDLEGWLRSDSIRRDMQSVNDKIGNMLYEYSEMKKQIEPIEPIETIKSNDTDTHQTQIIDLDVSNLCLICMTNKKDVVFLKCKHLCVCSKCVEMITKQQCPLCRTKYESSDIMKVFG